MAIARHFETEEEYREYPALSSSLLSQYWNKGIYSPDHALMKFEYQSYFEYGKMFETLLQDTVKGTDEFHDRFFITDVSSERPNDLIKWIENGDDLDQYYKYNKPDKKTGIAALSKTNKGTHAYLDQCKDNPGLVPVSKDEYEMLMMHVDRMCKMKFHKVSCGDLLAKGEWQVGIKWKGEYDQIPKKALLDVIVDLGGSYLVIDIKTSVEEKKFGYMLKDKYWIQDRLYCEGVESVFGPIHHQHQSMLFLVAYKTKPYLCQPRSVDHDSIDSTIQAIEEYNDLCKSYSEWDGKPRGWLPMKTDKLYLPNRSTA